MTGQSETITVARPGPDDVLLAVTGADGAKCWTSCKKADLGELGPGLLLFLEEGQQMLRDQHQPGDGDHG